MMRPKLVAAVGLVFVNTVRLAAAVGDDFSVNLLTLVPFTFEGKEQPYFGNEQRNNLGFSHMAAAILAMDHFNERNPAVVPQLARAEFANESCAIHFANSSIIADTQARGSEAVSVVLQQLSDQQRPDAIAGAYHDEPALELSVVASSLKIPFVAYGGSNIRVVTPYYFPYSSRTAADVIEIGAVATSFLFHKGRTNYIGILQAASETASQLAEWIFDTATTRGAQVNVVTYVPPVLSGTESDIEDSIRRLKDTGFRTFVLIVGTNEDELPLIADGAEKLGLNNGDYFWLIMGDMEINVFSSPNVTDNVNVGKLLKGSAFVKALDRFVWDPSHDRFLASWRTQNATFAQMVNAKNPIEPGSPGFNFAPDDYFQTIDPEPGSGFLYDSIMSIGMGLCRAKQSGNLSEWSIVASTQLASFDGATGPVSFGSNAAYPGGRSAGTLTFGAFNLLPPLRDSRDVSSPGYVLTSKLPSGRDVAAEWTDVTTFYFADGSTSPPELLRDPPEQIYLSSWARIIGFTLLGLALSVIIGAAIWVYIYRNKRVVKASQPEFLYALDFGSASISFAILLNSFDEDYGWSAERLGRLCTAAPWVVFLGVSIIYSALFTKLWRINRLLQFRRVTIKVAHVLWPFLILFISAVIVLTVWTVEEGFEWVLVEVDNVTGETMGKCKGINSVEYFTPVFLLTVIPVLLTTVMAWKTRDIDSSYSESGWIFALIAIHLQVLVVAIPVLVILEGRATNARYLGQVAVFFLYPMSTVGLIIGPKVYDLHFKPESTRGSSGGRVRVSGVKNPPRFSMKSTASSGVADNSGAESTDGVATVPVLRKQPSRRSTNQSTSEANHSAITFRLQDSNPTSEPAITENQDQKSPSPVQDTRENPSSPSIENEDRKLSICDSPAEEA